MSAHSLSYRELMILRGRYPLPIRSDVVPISDGAGDIAAMGEGIGRDLVVATASTSGSARAPVVRDLDRALAVRAAIAIASP